MPLFLFQMKSKLNVRIVVVLTVAGILLVILMAACGGGGSSSPTPPPTTKTLLTPPGSYSVTVTATSGTTSKNMTLNVVVQ
jgi:multidrug efflux pump subunit AcrA (membrane-fusion protein)